MSKGWVTNTSLLTVLCNSICFLYCFLLERHNTQLQYFVNKCRNSEEKLKMLILFIPKMMHIHYQLNLVPLAALRRSSNKFYEQQTHTILQNTEHMNHPETHNYDKTNPNISSQVRVKLNSNRFSKHSGNPFLSTGRSDTLISVSQTKRAIWALEPRPLSYLG